MTQLKFNMFKFYLLVGLLKYKGGFRGSEGAAASPFFLGFQSVFVNNNNPFNRLLSGIIQSLFFLNYLH